MLDIMKQNPPITIALLGGGQLGKMMTQEAKRMGFAVVVLDPTPESPAAQVADRQIIAEFTDAEAIRTLADSADLLTYEFEHINSDVLLQLEAEGYPVYPTPRVLKVIQNKRTQKEALAAAGIPVPPFMPIDNKEDLLAAGRIYGYPMLLKACTGGYDGKGNYKVTDASDVDNALEALTNCELMAEKFVPFTMEVSVVVARGQDGSIKTYELSENEHEDNILRRSIVPARVSLDIAEKAKNVAKDVMALFAGVGVFCVEMFVTTGGDILVNEVAPRPHNSGHYTIEACVTSQYEQQVRAITGLPLGDTRLITPVVMMNLLGDEKKSGPAILIGCAEALALPGVHLHVYGKKLTAPKRKMGHFTVTASTLDESLAIADEASHYLLVTAEKGDAKDES